MLNNSANELQVPLPIPHIDDDKVFYTHKKPSKRAALAQPKAPRVKLRFDHFNRSYHNSSGNLSSSAQAISFRSDTADTYDTDADTIPLCSVCYDSTSKDTFFEQCFERLEKIGEGSFGEVFKVRSKEDGKLYAVKMSKETFRGEHYRAERIEEVRRYQQFSGHDNCVRFFRAWQQDDRLYMQMELCRESLEHYAALHKDIPEDQIWEILLDLLLATKSLHDKDLIHLDIKLDNVLIGDDGTCKLADFGLVINVDKANRNKATEGDSRYIAPEIMQGVFSKAADIFSLGIAMLELCCYLELPPNGVLWQDLRRGELPEKFFAARGEELRAIIREMMAPNPLDRPTVDQLLANHMLSSLLSKRKSRWNAHYVRKKIARSRRLVFAKICNLKYVLFNFIYKLAQRWNMLSPKVECTPKKQNGWEVPSVNIKLTESTPIANRSLPLQLHDSLDNEVSPDSSHNGTPTNFIPDHMINSTPLSCNRRNKESRIYSSRTSLCATDTPMCYPSPPAETATNNNLDASDNEILSSSFRKHNDSSMLRRKKLFDAQDD